MNTLRSNDIKFTRKRVARRTQRRPMVTFRPRSLAPSEKVDFLAQLEERLVENFFLAISAALELGQ